MAWRPAKDARRNRMAMRQIEKPLHFIAQIDCASLPSELWGGLGPRDGWLLLFVDIEAIDEQEKRPIARVLHIADIGPETEPPASLYFDRRNLVDVGGLPAARLNVQRQPFRKWPVDLVPTSADTSELTGAEIYGAPENSLILTASKSLGTDRPMTWRGAYTVLAGLVRSHSAAGYESNWVGNAGGLLDYPEADPSGFNKEWQERRERLPEREQWGYFSPQFTEADNRLKAQIYDQRRKGWTQRAFKVLDKELGRDTKTLADCRAQVSAARARGDEKAVQDKAHSIEYFKKEDRHPSRKQGLSRGPVRPISQRRGLCRQNQPGRPRASRLGAAVPRAPANVARSRWHDGFRRADRSRRVGQNRCRNRGHDTLLLAKKVTTPSCCERSIGA